MDSRNPLMDCHYEEPRVSNSEWRRGNPSVFFIIAFLVTGCTSASPSPAPDSVIEGTALPELPFLSPAPPTKAPPIPGLSAEQIRNGPYQLGFTDALRIVQLSNGRYQEGVPGDGNYVEIHVTDFIALGDINGDGLNEAAALVAEDYGGTGVFVFLALYVAKAGEPEFLTSVFIDDRPVIESLGFEENQIFLGSITHDADDPFCCATLKNERHYRLIDNHLKLTDYTTFTPQGKPRTISIESPVLGAEVFRSVQVKGTVSVAPFENNLVYRIYDLGAVELSAGALMVTASELGGPGTFDTRISLGIILSGAVIRIEVQDVSAADGSLLAMDSVELVVK